MSAATIKYIASFSEEAINTALRCTITDDDQKKTFEDTLNSIAAKLVKPTRKRKMTPVLPSDDVVFRNNVVPQIREKLAEYEDQNNKGNDVVWKIALSYNSDFSTADLTALKATHALIVKEEETICNLQLIVVFHRGLLYLSARRLAPADANIRDWFMNEFGVSYVTILRYQAFAALILRYPRLIVCGLSFTQIMKHKDRIMKYLKEDTQLETRLTDVINISAQDTPVDIHPSVECNVPKCRFSVDPDYFYEDCYYDPAAEDTPADVEWEAWFAEVSRKEDFWKILFGGNEEMETSLQDSINELTISQLPTSDI